MLLFGWATIFMVSITPGSYKCKYSSSIIAADHTGPQWQVAVTIVKNCILNPITTFNALMYRSAPLFPPAFPSVISEAYSEVVNHPGYRAVLAGKDLKLVTGTIVNPF